MSDAEALLDEEQDSNHSDHSSSAGAHCHTAQKTRASGIDKKARRQLIVASLLCLVFMTAEIIGGVLANSLAIKADAAHLLTDLASYMISLFSLYLGSRPATKRMNFGWHRAEVMGATISVLLIWVITGVLIHIAVDRIISRDYEIDASIMLITAGAGVVVNTIMGLTLQVPGYGGDEEEEDPECTNLDETIVPIINASNYISYGSASETTVGDTDIGVPRSQTGILRRTLSVGKSSSTSSSQSVRVGLVDDGSQGNATKKQASSINVRAAFIHVVGDLIQSIGVLIAAFIIYYKPEWKIVDPICTFLFSVLVLITTITILRDTLNVLMEGTPRGINFKEVKASLCSIEGVKELHNLRLWSLTMDNTAVSVHLVLDEHGSSQHVLAKAGRIMTQKFRVFECTVQIENYVDDMTECALCQEPRD